MKWAFIPAILIVLLMILVMGGCNPSLRIDLQAGQNTVVYPGETIGVEDATIPIRDEMQSICYWDGSAWLVYTPGPAYDDLSILVKGQTYNVYMEVDKTWIIPTE